MIGHIGDDAIAARFETRATAAEKQLEKITSDRAITDEQFTALSSALRSSSGGQEYQITTFWDMREPLALANRVHAALTAGWKYIKPPSPTMLLGGQEGIQVWVHPEADAKVRTAADRLVAELDNLKLAPVLRLQNPQNPIDKRRDRTADRCCDRPLVEGR